MTIGKIELPKQIDIGTRLGGSSTDFGAPIPQSGATERFATALRRRAGSDADPGPTGRDRAPGVRKGAQEATNAASRTDDAEATDNPARDEAKLHVEDQANATETGDRTPEDAAPVDESERAQESDADDAAEPDDGNPAGSTDDDTSTDAADSESKRSHTAHNTIELPTHAARKPDQAQATPRTGQAGDAQAAPDPGTPQSDAEATGADPDADAALARARARARLSWEKSGNTKPAPNNDKAPSKANADLATPTNASSDAQGQPASPNPAQPVASAQAGAHNPDQTNARDTIPHDAAARLANTQDTATRGTPPDHHDQTTKDRPDERGNGAHSVRTTPDTPAPAKATTQADPLFRLTLDGATTAAQTPKPAQAESRAGAGTTTADRALAAGLSRGIGAVLNQKGGALTMRLTPASLGEVRIVMNLKGGQVSVELEAGNARAHELLRSQLPALKQTLEAKGLTVERLGVQLSANAHQGHAGSGADQQGGAGGGRPEDAGTQHDAGDGRSRGARDGNPDAHDGGRGGDAQPSAFEELFDGLEAESDAMAASSVRLGLDAVV